MVMKCLVSQFIIGGSKNWRLVSGEIAGVLVALSSLPGLDQTGTGLPWIDGSKEWNLNLISTEIWLCLLSLGQQIMEGGNEGRRKW